MALLGTRRGDGEITYSAQPVPGAAESVAVDIPSLTPEKRRAARRLRLEERKISRKVTADVNESRSNGARWIGRSSPRSRRLRKPRAPCKQAANPTPASDEAMSAEDPGSQNRISDGLVTWNRALRGRG